MSSMNTKIPMSAPTRRLPEEANRDEAQEEQAQQGDQRLRHILLQNTEEIQGPSTAPIVAQLLLSLNSQTLLSSNPTYRGLLPSFPALNPRTDTYVNLLCHLPLAASVPVLPLDQVNPVFLHDASGFCGLLPQLHPQPLDPLTQSSLELELLAAAIARRPIAKLPSPDTVGLESQLAAAQRTNAALLYPPNLLRPTPYPSNQWPSTGGLLGSVQDGCSSVPNLQTSTSPLARGTGYPSALSSAARATEQALPFSAEEESQIPLVGGPELFPMVLHRALAELELVAGGNDIATFLPDGRSFCIKDQARFAKEILPIFFPRMKGFASFQRQLNLYDFKRVGGVGAKRGAYHHVLFVRDHPAMSSGMRRIKNKGHHPIMKLVLSATSETEGEATDMTSTGEASSEQKAASTHNADADVSSGERNASDTQEPGKDKGNLD